MTRRLLNKMEDAEKHVAEIRQSVRMKMYEELAELKVMFGYVLASASEIREAVRMELDRDKAIEMAFQEKG